jgi:uncharacterized surface protein with fasciclin (FAS1) repeats
MGVVSMKKVGLVIVLLITMVLFASGCSQKAPDNMKNETEKMPDKNIVQTAEDAGSFTTLITAIKAAGLEETLSGKGPFTVFAPTDEAFAALPNGTLDSLLQNKTALTKVLTYHVASGNYTASDIVGMKSIKTLEGSDLQVNTVDGVKVGDANVTTADIETSNGVIHVIDKVQIPPE